VEISGPLVLEVPAVSADAVLPETTTVDIVATSTAVAVTANLVSEVRSESLWCEPAVEAVVSDTFTGASGQE
jgi:hypothetical protein